LSLKKLITELGFSGDLKRTRLLLKALRADWGEKPKLLMRYDTGNGCDVVVQYLNMCEIGNEKCWERGSNLGIVDFLVTNPRNHFDIVWNLE
jgi:hypothetical protein